MFRRPATLVALLALSCAAGATQAPIVDAKAVHPTERPACTTPPVDPSVLDALSPEAREYVEWVATAPHDVLVAVFARSVAPTY